MNTNEMETEEVTAAAIPDEENELLNDEEQEIAEEDELDLREIRTSDDVNEPDPEDDDLDITGVEGGKFDEERKP